MSNQCQSSANDFHTNNIRQLHPELCLRNLGIRKRALKRENLNMERWNTCVHKSKKVRVGRPKFQLEFCQKIENKKVRVDWHTLENQSPKMGPQKAPQALRWLENGTFKSPSPKMGLQKAPQALRWLEKPCLAGYGWLFFQIRIPQGILTSRFSHLAG